MFDKEYFLNRLRSGENIDTVGQEIADAMNDAVEAYETEQMLAKQAETAKVQAKREIMECMVNCVKDFAELEGFSDIADHITEKDIEDLTNSFTQMFSLMRMFDKAIAEPIAKPVNKTASKAPRTDDEVLNDFIKSLLS